MKRLAPIVLVAVAALALAAPTYTVCEAHLDSIAGIITRETGDYAHVLQVNHIRPGEQSKAVKRAKDRIKKRLQRADWSDFTKEGSG